MSDDETHQVPKVSQTQIHTGFVKKSRLRHRKKRRLTKNDWIKGLAALDTLLIGLAALVWINYEPPPNSIEPIDPSPVTNSPTSIKETEAPEIVPPLQDEIPQPPPEQQEPPPAPPQEEEPPPEQPDPKPPPEEEETHPVEPTAVPPEPTQEPTEEPEPTPTEDEE